MDSSRDLTDEYRRNIPLSEMLTSLRQELEVAKANAHDKKLLFKVPEIELELTMNIVREKSVEGGVKADVLKFFVLSGKGQAKATDETTHTFKLKLIPEDWNVKSEETGKPPGSVKVSESTKERPE